jgi:hypothetical protein
MSRTLRQALVDAHGFRSPARDDAERRQKAWAVAEFQGATGFTNELLETPVDVISEAVATHTDKAAA